MAPFPSLDWLDLDSELTSEQRETVRVVRAFVNEQVEPEIRGAYRTEQFPRQLIPKLGELGLLGANLPGEGGLGPIGYGLVMRELERCDSGLRSFASVQGALAMYAIHAFGSDAQKQRWLGPLRAGTAVGCFGLTESEGGSDPGGMKTRAVREGGRWILNGSKMWITNGNLSAVAVVWARHESGIRGFLVPTDTPGFRAVPMSGKLSLRASNTAELFLDGVSLPDEALLPGTTGLKSALECLNQARYGIAWGVLGAAEACFEEARAHVAERKVFGRPLAGFQLVQRKLALMASRITQGQWLAFRLGQLKERGGLTPAQVSLGKQANTEMALEVARSARDILGAHGIMDEYRTMRHLCNLETVYTYEGTNDIHLLVLGKEITGLSAFGG